MAKTSYKSTVLPWVLKWQLLLQTSAVVGGAGSCTVSGGGLVGGAVSQGPSSVCWVITLGMTGKGWHPGDLSGGQGFYNGMIRPSEGILQFRGP